MQRTERIALKTTVRAQEAMRSDQVGQPKLFVQDSTERRRHRQPFVGYPGCSG